MKKAPLFLATAVLLVALGLQVLRRCVQEPAQPRTALAAQLPRELAGWKAADRPIAETAEMRRAVGELLNFDDAVLRVYRRGGYEIEVYAAFWQPGKMSPRLVAGHTPDVCWPAGGWRQESPEELPALVRSLLPGAEHRLFIDPRARVRRWVIFRHYSGGEPVSHLWGRTDGEWQFWGAGALRHGIRPWASQSFVRVSANAPWLDLMAEPGVTTLLSAAQALDQPAQTTR